MAQNLTIDHPVIGQVEQAKPSTKATLVLAYSLMGLGGVGTVAWSGVLVWIATEGVFWLVGELS
jgi:hypothetical protein